MFQKADDQDIQNFAFLLWVWKVVSYSAARTQVASFWKHY